MSYRSIRVAFAEEVYFYFTPALLLCDGSCRTFLLPIIPFPLMEPVDTVKSAGRYY
jgi:hypothetical protein